VAEQRVQRRLAAILAADVVGYSRLMGEDETGTRARFNAHLAELIEPAIASLRGRIVKTTGDALLVEFASVVGAVECACKFQKGMAERNADEPDDRRMEFRIGVNLGDVIIEGDDIHGDGVNIAARLEALADAGGVCISDKVYEEIRNRIDLTFESLGDKKVKNIDRPVGVWQWRLRSTPALVDAVISGEALSLPDKPSIAVLPFINMSGDQEQEFFADGMAEDIITALSRIPWFFVIARNSSFSYKARGTDAKQVASELGVKYLLEGSVRKAGNRLRITAQLVDCTTDRQVWTERYDREIADIFDVQDEVVRAIVGAVAPEFLSSEAKSAERKAPTQLDAWECVMRGRAHLWKFNREEAAKGRALFERAIALSSNGEFGASDLALVHCLEWYYRWGESPEEAYEAMQRTAEIAVAADKDDPWALTTLAWAYIFSQRIDEGLDAARQATDLCPNFAPAIGAKAACLTLICETASSIETFHEAIRLSPRDGMMVFWLMVLFLAYFGAKRYEDAVNTVQSAIRLAPDNPTFRRQHAAGLAMVGRMDEARTALGEYRRLEPDHTLADASKVPTKVSETLERWVDALRKAGMPE